MNNSDDLMEKARKEAELRDNLVAIFKYPTKLYGVIAINAAVSLYVKFDPVRDVFCIYDTDKLLVPLNAKCEKKYLHFLKNYMFVCSRQSKVLDLIGMDLNYCYISAVVNYPDRHDIPQLSYNASQDMFYRYSEVDGWQATDLSNEELDSYEWEIETRWDQIRRVGSPQQVKDLMPLVYPANA